MEITRIAFIGSRGHYKVVLDELASLDQARVVATADGGDTAAPIRAWCDEHRHAHEHFDDHRTLLDRGKPDMVVVCGPFEMHASMCIDSIERGIHVLSEKCVALTVQDLDRLRDACADSPEVHLAGMMFRRYTPGFY